MKQNQNYSINELLSNDDFIAWITSNNEKHNHYWVNIKKELKGENKSNFKKAIVIIKKIKSLNLDHSHIKSPEFIQQQYITLLESKTTSNKLQPKVIQWSKILPYAAAVVLLISLSSLFYYYNADKNSFDQHLVEGTDISSEIILQTSDNVFYEITENTNNKWLSNNGVFISVDADKISFVATDDVDLEEVNNYKLIIPKGKKYHLKMLDGTDVELNANTSLKFSNTIFTKNREVELYGEAFFDVSHNQNSPFIVSTSTIQIEVLGTEFNVSNYKENDFVRTTLIDGSVKVSNAIGEEIKLQPGEQATIYNNQNEILVQQSDVQQAVAWMAGRLIFNDEKLESLIPRLNQWYGVNFILIGDEIKKMRFTGTLKKENDLIYFLQMLKYTEGISYEINNEQVRLFVN